MRLGAAEFKLDLPQYVVKRMVNRVASIRI